MAPPTCCVTHFIEGLPRVIDNEMDIGEPCPICYEQYDQSGEEPVSLPCDHVIGHECLDRWLWDEHKSTCPCCRRVLLPPQQRIEVEDMPEEDEPGPLNQDHNENHFYVEDHDDIPEYWQIVDLLNFSEAERDNARQTRSNRERQTWVRLVAAGADLPPLQPDRPGDRRPLSEEEVILLFSALERRGAFNVRRFENVRDIDGEISNRQLFTILRDSGFVWRPRMRWSGGRISSSGWSTSSVGERLFMATVDAEEYQAIILDYRQR